jgi:hypothetical protein
MTEQSEAEFLARVESALRRSTDGDWIVRPDGSIYVEEPMWTGKHMREVPVEFSGNTWNPEFAATAHAAIPRLLTIIAARDEALRQAREEIAERDRLTAAAFFCESCDRIATHFYEQAPRCDEHRFGAEVTQP